MKRKSIACHFIYPPIPTRQHDWQAFYMGREEIGNYGYGATRKAAIADLIANFPPDTCRAYKPPVRDKRNKALEHRP